MCTPVGWKLYLQLGKFKHRSWDVGLWFRSIILITAAPLNAGFENYFLGDVKHGAKKYMYLHTFSHSIQCI